MKHSNIIQQTISDNLKYFLKQKDEAILNKDPDALHRMRVSGRKLRISFWSFKQLFPRQKYNKIKKDIRRPCKSSNQARDLDTQIAMLLKLNAEKHVIKHLQDRRIKLQPQINKSLARLDGSRLTEKINRCLKNSKASLDNQALLEISRKKINNRLHRLLSHTNCINYQTKLSQLHALRISAKHLRYTLELFQPLYARKLNNFISNARSIQKTLGDMRNYLILSRCRALVNLQFKKRLIFLANKSYLSFTTIWENQSIWSNLNALINRKKTS